MFKMALNERSIDFEAVEENVDSAENAENVAFDTLSNRLDYLQDAGGAGGTEVLPHHKENEWGSHTRSEECKDILFGVSDCNMV